MTKQKNIDAIADFFFETGILSKTPRSGFHFLGSGEQSVAEHITRVMYVGYALATLEKKVNIAKVLEMCLFHDLAEARTSDLNYIHQQYTNADEKKAVAELAATVPFGKSILRVLREYQQRASKESKLARDADQLEWILSLKEQLDIGNVRAKSWIPSAVKRLKTATAKKLAKKILQTDSSHWWFHGKDERWWVSRDPKALRKRF